MNIEYRLFKPNDINELSVLYVESWKRTYNNIIPIEYLNQLNIDMTKEKFINFIKDEKDSFIYVAIDTEKQVLCGFSVCKRDDLESDTGLLYSLHVQMGYKNCGIGKSLIKKSAQYFRNEIGLNSLLLWVVIGNDNAYNVYTKLGALVLKNQITLYANIEIPEVCLIWKDTNHLIKN